MPQKKAKPSSPSLKSLSREELETIIYNLYENFDNVRNFIDLRMTGNSEPLVKKYKKLIKKRLVEDIEQGTDGLDEALRAVRDFALLGPSPYDQADVMLCFVETAVDFINNYGDMYEDFYDETGDLYFETLEFLQQHNLLNDFKTRCKIIVDESVDTGYGFNESLRDSFYTYFPEKEGNRKTIHVKKAVPRQPLKISRPQWREK